MIGDQPDRDILLLVRLVLHAGSLADLIPDRLHSIDIKYGIHILNDYREPFQSHTRIDILLRQLLIMPLAVTIKLCEHIVPHFYKTVTVAAHFAVRLSAAVLFTSVIIDLRTWSAWPCSMFPEIITLPCLRIPIKTCDLLIWDTDLIYPDIIGFLIFTVYRWV